MPRDLISPDLTHPSLAGLEWILRNRYSWPDNWLWFFSHVTDNNFKPECGTAGCAYGIALRYWEEARAPWHNLTRGYEDQVTAVIETFDISRDTARLIFFHGLTAEITPLIIADRISDHLAGRPIRFLCAGDRDKL
jgi:hypothetical protein